MKTMPTKCCTITCKPPIVNQGLKDQFEFAKKDKDDNGSVSASEHMAGANRKEVLARGQEFKRYDTDGDGQLSKDEFVRGRQSDRLREAIQHRPRPDFKPLPVGAGAEEKPSGLLGKLLKGLAFTNPITAPLAIGNWVREKIAG